MYDQKSLKITQKLLMHSGKCGRGIYMDFRVYFDATPSWVPRRCLYRPRERVMASLQFYANF